MGQLPFFAFLMFALYRWAWSSNHGELYDTWRSVEPCSYHKSLPAKTQNKVRGDFHKQCQSNYLEQKHDPSYQLVRQVDVESVSVTGSIAYSLKVGCVPSLKAPRKPLGGYVDQACVNHRQRVAE